MIQPNTTGPALAYASTRTDDGPQVVYLVDREAPSDPRERAICRALLQHALCLLDASEPTRPIGTRAERPDR